jgi:asparagine synthase (glutamine-hydrolysing)
MCGIAGGVFWDRSTSASSAEDVVAAMVKAMAHRGPDGHAVRVAESPAGGPIVVLGHRRLAILDVSSSGAQPMGGANQSSTITYNGEAYNFTSLKSALAARGATFTTRTDTEVILRGYDAWGIDVLKRLRGMFALALWDRTKRQMLLARDRLGIKPLYYFRGDGVFLFASEVRALLATGLVPKQLDRIALWQYLSYQSIPAPRTLVEGVRVLPPAQWMTVGHSGDINEGSYWNMLSATAEPVDLSPEEARRRVGDLLRDAVDAHMVSDVPVGAFLSGGIDSSAVVALMREGGHTPRTFSVGFDEDGFDESAHADLVARLYRAEHTHIPLSGSDLLEQLPGVLDTMDQPTGDAVNTYIVSAAVRARGIAVAQSGLGGDEVFGGYPSFRRLTQVADLARLWGKSPEAWRSLAAGTVRALGRSSVQASKAAAVMESDGTIATMFPPMRQLLSTEQRLTLLDETFLESIPDRTDPYEPILADAFAHSPTATVFARVSFAEARTYMHDVLLRDTDQMSMAHGLEVRVPLLDHLLVELVMALPDSMKRSGTTPKRLLVESLGGLLPDSIARRPKRGFTLPFDPWMRGPLRSMCEERLGDRGLSGRGLFNPAKLHALWQSFLGGGRDVSWSRLWMLVVLDAWLDRHQLVVA